jgi:hypothetical protein
MIKIRNLPFKGLRNKKLVKEGLPITVGILGALAVIGIAFFIMQRYLSVFSYLGMNPADVDRVRESFESKCEPISYACRQGFWDKSSENCRGVYLCGGFPVYWHHSQSSKGSDYSIYPILWSELWSSKRDWSGFTGETHVY